MWEIPDYRERDFSPVWPIILFWLENKRELIGGAKDIWPLIWCKKSCPCAKVRSVAGIVCCTEKLGCLISFCLTSSDSTISTVIHRFSSEHRVNAVWVRSVLGWGMTQEQCGVEFIFLFCVFSWDYYVDFVVLQAVDLAPRQTCRTRRHRARPHRADYFFLLLALFKRQWCITHWSFPSAVRINHLFCWSTSNKWWRGRRFGRTRKVYVRGSKV